MRVRSDLCGRWCWPADLPRRPACGSPTLPCDIEFSFYERQPALLSSVVIVLPADPSRAPKDVEIWIAGPAAGGSFAKVAALTLDEKTAEQKVAFPPAEAQFVRLRILNGRSADRLELAEVRILEARREGYAPLFDRRPDAKSWNGSPRQAVQLGLDWLQQAAPDWDRKHKCFGCHVQAQVLMGQAIARRNNYIVNEEAFSTLEAATRQYQQNDETGIGYWFDRSISATQFGALALVYSHDRGAQADDPAFRNSVDWLVGHQAGDGSVWVDHDDPPIVQGRFMTSANSVQAFLHAFERTPDPRFRAAADRALAWIAANEPETTQDRVYKAIALSRFGTPEQKRLVGPVLDRLVPDQQPDGGWKEHGAANGSNAFATGQVLYAFKQAGASTHSTIFRRGVRYLLATQVRDTASGADGVWPAKNTAAARPTDFAPTMWAVIGLAGAFSVHATGGLVVALNTGREKPASRNLEFVLDASGSMKRRLGSGTRWQVALDVLQQVVSVLPADFNVGLRTYGHRFSPRSPQTCTDTELVVPPARLDRQRILDVARRLRPRGETPLVRSVLSTVDDLRPLGNGTVILVTDGEESCKGDLGEAASRLKASGVDLSVNIVGFTLAGRAVEEQLRALATAAGGEYYSAQSGEALARAVTLAALQALPFDVFNGAGQLVASGETGRHGLELAPGTYRVMVRAPGQELSESVTVLADAEAVLEVSLRGGRFAVESR